MPDDTPAPYPSQKESDEMVLAAVAARPLAQTHLVAREGEDLTPYPSQAEADAMILAALGAVVPPAS